MAKLFANSGDPDQTLCSAASDLGLSCLPSTLLHICHKLLTEICEILQIFKGDLMKFCEIFMKITFKLT